MRSNFLFFLIILLCVSTVNAVVPDTLTATNCEGMGLQSEVCAVIHEAAEKDGVYDLEMEKELLLIFLSQGDVKQMHAQAKYWNANIKPEATVPEGESAYTSEFLLNAWVKTLAVSPSVVENGNLFIMPNGTVQSAYYYELSAPGKDGAGINGTDCACDDDIEDGDLNYIDIDDDGEDDNYCRVDYYYIDLSKVRVKMNGVVVQELNASDEFEEINTGTDKYSYNIAIPYVNAAEINTFKTELDLKSMVYERKYRWNREEECTSWCYDDDGDRDGHRDRYYCRLSDERTYKSESKMISNELKNANMFHPDLETHQVTFSHIETTPQGIVTSDADDYEIQMKNGVVGKKSSEYTITAAVLPYNILTVNKNPGRTSYYSHDAFIDATTNSTAKFTTFTYNVEDDKDCFFSYFNPFGRIVEECNSFKKATTTLEVSTDKQVYDVEDTVEIKVDFDSDNGDDAADILITYGDKKYNVKTGSSGRETISLDAEYGGKTITASFSGDSERSSVKAAGTSISTKRSNINDYFNIVVMGFIAYGIIFACGKYMGAMER